MQGAWVRPLVRERRFPRAVWPKQKKTAHGATRALPASAPTTPVMKLSGLLCGSTHTPSPHIARVLSCSLVSDSREEQVSHNGLEGGVISRKKPRLASQLHSTDDG